MKQRKKICEKKKRNDKKINKYNKQGRKIWKKQKVELYNIKEDPNETQKLLPTKHRNIVRKLKKIIKNDYQQVRFPEHYKMVKAAYPGNNNGVFVTGWCS